MRTAPARGRGMALGAALAASLAPPVGQLAFAAVAIGVVGMAHGASDLAVVPPASRSRFLAWYGLVCALCLAWWVARPAIALPLFLAASAIHFGLEDAPGAAWAERLAHGGVLVAAPATLHPGAVATVLALAGLPAHLLAATTHALGITGGLAAVAIATIALGRRDVWLLAGTAALLLLPPLVGFGAGFLILHALPQTAARREAIGCADDLAYLRATWPILLAAIVLAGAVGVVLLAYDPSGVRSLFAAIAALAMPHLLVTPWFEGMHAGDGARGRSLTALNIRTAA